MFQTFDIAADPAVGPARVKAIRTLMAKAGLDAWLVPRADEHQGEYVPASAERLQWLTGFTGSAGMAIVTTKSAALATDGRYTIQAQAQIDGQTFELIDIAGKPWLDWLATKLPHGGVIGYDPRLHTGAAIAALNSDAPAHGFKLKPVTRNLVDKAWSAERPPPPVGAVSIQPIALAGVAAEKKIADLQADLVRAKQAAVVLTLPDSICWLFNIRGSDIPHNPTVLAFALVPAKGKPELFVDAAKLGSDVKKYLAGITKIAAPDALAARLKALKDDKDKKIRVDPATASQSIVAALGAAAVHGVDPCILPKAKKNAAELAGTRAAHVRDGVAMVRFLFWLDAHAETGSLDEIALVEKLEQCRRDTDALKDISFATIAGAGPNGALPHYRVTRTTNRALRKGEFVVIDSGAQYQDGTTDITRTVAIGSPTAEMRARYTDVLRGHIAIATARFPVGTRGVQLDTLARNALWQSGCDFDHGTGHGVGCFLSVHEGPQSISKRGMAELVPGMIVSNEPGYYKTGAFGIRIENLEVVTGPADIKGGERPMLGFESLTLAPIDTTAIDPKRLTPHERAWLDAYHGRVFAALGPHLPPAERTWLKTATQRLDE